MTAPKPNRPPGLAHGRWLGDFPELSAAEKALVAACARGATWQPVGWAPVGCDGERPEEATDANTIRAGLIRFLLLGGDADHPVHEEGVSVDGAWISGNLNIHQARASVRLCLYSCHFAETPNFINASLPELSLKGSLCPGLKADRLKVEGGVFLGDKFHATKMVQLPGAEIGGNLDCDGGRFENPKKVAMLFQNISVMGALHLCSSGQGADGGVPNSTASVEGIINLTAARVGTLVDGDTLACWQGGRHILDGFRYDRIFGFIDAARRIDWLKLQREDQLTSDFKPQPWEQLIKVLREMGHPHAASEVAIAKQEQMRVAGVINGPMRRPLHWLYGQLAGYGHRPLRAVGWMLAVWLFCSFCFDLGREYGYFGPSNPLIHTSPAYASCGGPGETLPDGTAKPFWHTPACPTPPEYSTLYPPLYSLDLILPLVDLQQETDWAPIVINENGAQLFLGYALRALMWFEILFGWAMSLMLVAVLGRLVEKD